MFESLKKTIADLPIADIHKARVELALEQAAASETQVGELRTQVAHLTAQLEIATANQKKAELELAALREAHTEDIRIVRATEFRRGTRTAGKWIPFCARCHCPAGSHERDSYLTCSDRKCDWISLILCYELDGVVASIT